MVEKRLKILGIFGIISLLSYTAMVVFSPLAYPGYDWLSMAVCVGAAGCRPKMLKLGIYCFAAMEWVCNVGYDLFPWVNNAPSSDPQNVMHLGVTILVVVLSLAALVLVAIGAGRERLNSLRIWAVVCLTAMMVGPIGTALLPKAVFGLFERFSTFSAVVFNAVLGIYLMKGRFTYEKAESRR